ncbi:MAG: response regulator [Alphaproteobacteria bacterium]
MRSLFDVLRERAQAMKPEIEGFSFDRVRVVLAERNLELRSNLKSWLNHLGLGQVRVTRRVAEAWSMVADETPDLLIGDVDLIDGNMCDLFRAVRNQDTGANPFVPIIAMSRSANARLARRVIDAGADALLIKPVSTKVVAEKITALIRNRKSFVVTSDYVGPDRRTISREGQRSQLIVVPNSLAAKALAHLDDERIRGEIAAATAEVNERRMVRDVDEIGWLAQRVVANVSGGLHGKDCDAHATRLLHMGRDLGRRVTGTRFDHVSDLCESLARLMQSLLNSDVTAEAKEAKLLPYLANAIRVAFKADEHTAAIARDISDSVTRLDTH